MFTVHKPRGTEAHKRELAYLKIDVSREHTSKQSSEYHTVLKTCSLNLSVKAPS